MTTEHAIQQDIFAFANGRPDIRLFRNSVGLGYVGKTVFTHDGVFIKPFRKVHFGLRPGSADLIGWKTIEVTQEMVGSRIAVFSSIEVKAPGKRQEPEQGNWMRQVQAAGGIAGVARTVINAEYILNSCISDTI